MEANTLKYHQTDSRTRSGMQPRLTLAITVLVLAVPSALALPLPGAAPHQADGIEPTGTVQAVRDAATTAAGIGGPGAPVSPVLAPVTGNDWTPELVGAAVLTGIAALGTAAFFFGGARFVTPAEVLENDVRQQIYAYLKQSVGANLKQLTDDLHLTTTNAIWHLRKLEEAGLIHSRRFNGYKVFYPAEGGVEARRLSLGKTALQNENAQEVFEHVVLNPGTHQREIARALGVNHGTVRWHLKKLLHAELIVETRRGKAASYEPTEMGLSALREVGAKSAAIPGVHVDVTTAA
jgi:predicted transcriptional regulator